MEEAAKTTNQSSSAHNQINQSISINFLIEFELVIDWRAGYAAIKRKWNEKDLSFFIIAVKWAGKQSKKKTKSFSFCGALQLTPPTNQINFINFLCWLGLPLAQYFHSFDSIDLPSFPFQQNISSNSFQQYVNEISLIYINIITVFALIKLNRCW